MSPPDCPCIPIKNFQIGVCYAGYVCSTDWDEPEAQVRSREPYPNLITALERVGESHLGRLPCAHLGLKGVACAVVRGAARVPAMPAGAVL